MRLLQEYAQLQRASALKSAPRGGSPGGTSDDVVPPTAPDRTANPAPAAVAPAGRPGGRCGTAGSGGTVGGTEGAAGAQPLRSARLALVELRERVPLAQAALLVAPLLDAGAGQVAASEMSVKVRAAGVPYGEDFLLPYMAAVCM